MLPQIENKTGKLTTKNLISSINRFSIMCEKKYI